MRDGGAKIDGYIISYQVEGQPEKNWTQYSVVKDLNIVVVGLKEGTKYKFRVAARNSVGVSLPREAEGMFEIKEQLCKLYVPLDLPFQFYHLNVSVKDKFTFVKCYTCMHVQYPPLPPPQSPPSLGCTFFTCKR